MVPGTTAKDYYEGKVTQAVPEQAPSLIAGEEAAS
jgi:hypothetical protein